MAYENERQGQRERKNDKMEGDSLNKSTDGSKPKTSWVCPFRSDRPKSFTGSWQLSEKGTDLKVPVSPVGLIDPDEGIVRGAKTEASST
jgi:hypothetical protein